MCRCCSAAAFTLSPCISVAYAVLLGPAIPFSRCQPPVSAAAGWAGRREDLKGNTLGAFDVRSLFYRL